MLALVTGNDPALTQAREMLPGLAVPTGFEFLFLPMLFAGLGALVTLAAAPLLLAVNRTGPRLVLSGAAGAKLRPGR